MKYKFILLFISWICFSLTQAQERRVTIVDELERLAPGEGAIRISSDPRITNLIGSLASEWSDVDETIVKLNGFRIQVFMSNNPRTARNEIEGKRNLIHEGFPEIADYQEYTAPFHRLLVGDFMTREEAEVFMQRMQRTIPGLGREMYIVPAIVNISVLKNR
jgi:hypothetical protein